MVKGAEMYVNRSLEKEIIKSLGDNPVTAITGPRQCGKSTLTKKIISGRGECVYLDLEEPSDLVKLDNAEFFLKSQKNKLIVIDEIQRKADLFPLIRSLVDEWGRNGSFLILGSASKDMLRQSSESLAGRISYKKLSPFLYTEIVDRFSMQDYICKGGFPRSLLTSNDMRSAGWIDDFIITFLERDLLQWSGFSNNTMRRLWQMLAHNNGQTVNYSAIGNSLGVSNPTIKNYIDLLSGTYMIEILPPYHRNFGKRIIKAPKVYVSDTGICVRLLGLSGFEQISGHQVLGSLWESVVINSIKGHLPKANLSFFRTSNGAEIDIIIEIAAKVIAVECKFSLSPKLTKGNHFAISTIKPDHTYVVSPVFEGWPLSEGVDIVSIIELLERL